MTSYKTITCQQCGSEKDIPLGEYNRKIKIQTPFFCSRSCCGTFNIKSRDDFRAYNNSEACKRQLKANRDKLPPAEPFRYFLRNCKRRHKDFDLDIDYLKTVWVAQDGLCALTGVDLILPHGTKGFDTVKPFNGASLDRVDSSIGYIKGNVQLVCMGINFLKNDWEQDYLIQHLIIVSKSVLDKYKDLL